jgi:5-methylcytosine-specific restriction endonuclease McrA
VQKAVFYRDRGKCVLTGRDLSGLYSTLDEKNLDHIVPLAQGGLNDVSNIQLLSGDANREKGGIQITSSDYYERWYPIDLPG